MMSFKRIAGISLKMVIATSLTSCYINTRPVAYYPPNEPMVEQVAPAPQGMAYQTPPPAWAPPYNYQQQPAQYYYLPDIQTYYDVYAHEFVYYDGYYWQRSLYLPQAYANYNLNAGYVVVLNSNVVNPWMNHNAYVSTYPREYYNNNVYEVGQQRPRGYNENARQHIYNNGNTAPGPASPYVAPTPAAPVPASPYAAPAPAQRSSGYGNPNSAPQAAPVPSQRGAAPQFIAPQQQAPQQTAPQQQVPQPAAPQLNVPEPRPQHYAEPQLRAPEPQRGIEPAPRAPEPQRAVEPAPRTPEPAPRAPEPQRNVNQGPGPQRSAPVLVPNRPSPAPASNRPSPAPRPQQGQSPKKQGER